MSLFPLQKGQTIHVPRPRRDFYWRWPKDEQTWLMWAYQNYGDDWIVWRVGPLNYRVQIAKGGLNGGYIYYGKEGGNQQMVQTIAWWALAVGGFVSLIILIWWALFSPQGH